VEIYRGGVKKENRVKEGATVLVFVSGFLTLRVKIRRIGQKRQAKQVKVVTA